MRTFTLVLSLPGQVKILKNEKKRLGSDEPTTIKLIHD